MPRGIRYDRRGDMPPHVRWNSWSSDQPGRKVLGVGWHRVRTQGEEALVNQRELLRGRDVARFIQDE